MNGGLEISHQNKLQITCKTWLVYPPRHTKNIIFELRNRLRIIDGIGINYKIVYNFKDAHYTRVSIIHEKIRYIENIEIVLMSYAYIYIYLCQLFNIYCRRLKVHNTKYA